MPGTGCAPALRAVYGACFRCYSGLRGRKNRLRLRPRRKNGRPPVERTTGIEPAFSAWEADVLPINYIRDTTYILYTKTAVLSTVFLRHTAVFVFCAE